MIAGRYTPGAPLSEPFVGLRTSVSSAIFDPTGAWIATTEIDGSVRLWDVAAGRNIGGPLHNDPELAPIFLPGQGLRLLTTDSSRTAVWELGREGLVGTACHAAGRNLSRSEWLELGPKAEPFRATCNW